MVSGRPSGARTEQVFCRRPTRAAIAEGEAAGAAHVIGILGDFTMSGRDDEAVFVICNRHDVVHFLNHRAAHADAVGNRLIDNTVDSLGAHIGTHGEHAFQRRDDRLFLACRQKIGEVADRNAHGADIRQRTVHAELACSGSRLERRERWYVPDHWQGAVFRMEREGDLPVHRHLVDRRMPGGFQPPPAHRPCAPVRSLQDRSDRGRY